MSQVDEHVVANGLKESLQSAYKAGHSTETALLKVSSDLLQASDEGKVSLLTLLDLSAAFDTIDHSILLERLNISFGLSDIVLKWFESYMCNRHQTVVVGEHKSSPSLLDYGVPQDSVLGPVLFSLYSQSLSSILRDHDFNYHFYADDSQLQTSFEKSQVKSVTDSLSDCLTDVSAWMVVNKLKLNENKTEVIVTGTPSNVQAVNLSSLKICGQEIHTTSTVKNLGVLLDSGLSMDKHISHLRKTCYHELRKISHIRPYLSKESTTKLVCSLVTSRLDYCNALLAGLPDCKLKKLQQIQNNAARLTMKTSKRDHITPILKELHWLPIQFRIRYKISVIVYQCINNPYYPHYLKDLVKVYTPSRTLRSSYYHLLCTPRCNLNG